MDDLTRAGRAVEARIKELGMTYRAAADRAGCDPSTLWKVRTGDEPVSEQVRARISEALSWPADTIDRIVTDPGFTPPTVGLTDPERLAALERAVADLQEQVRQLRER